ncbi:MAG: hypothetical protein KME27_08245 [Lyngbya sp. HA4199-MV5]|jgi:hypothetical protein|nr:hypothetical protein [Lyngbya sp. HA4199-MV5]
MSRRRPASVWITQILLLFTVLLSLRAVVISFQLCPISASEACPIGLTQRLLELIFAVVYLTLAIVGLWGLQRRKKYGRWLGILFWAGFVAVLLSSDGSRMVYHFILHGSHDLPKLYPREYYKDFPMNRFYPTHSGLVIDAFSTIFVNLLFVALAAHFSLAKTVRQFFSKQE